AQVIVSTVVVVESFAVEESAGPDVVAVEETEGRQAAAATPPIVTVTLPAAASVPSDAVTTLPAPTLQVPWLGVQVTEPRQSGRSSVSVEPVAETGPEFVTVKVQETVSPHQAVVAP